MFRQWFLVGLAVGLLLGLGASVTYWRVAVEQGPETCIIGTTMMGTNVWGYSVVIGSQQLCGRDLRWGSVTGPPTLEDIDRLNPGAGQR